MVVKDNVKADYEFKYSNKKYQSIGNYYTFFDVPNTCPGVNSCEIREQGCENKYTGDKLQLYKFRLV